MDLYSITAQSVGQPNARALRETLLFCLRDGIGCARMAAWLQYPYGPTKGSADGQHTSSDIRSRETPIGIAE